VVTNTAGELPFVAAPQPAHVLALLALGLADTLIALAKTFLPALFVGARELGFVGAALHIITTGHHHYWTN
jgi:hypothetical protein